MPGRLLQVLGHDRAVLVLCRYRGSLCHDMVLSFKL